MALPAPTLSKGAGQTLTWTRPVGGVFPAELPQIATCASVQTPANGIKGIADLPAEAWSRIEEPRDGYHFLCEMYVYDRPFNTLLDGGGIFSLVWEGTLVAIVNHAIAQGKSAKDPEWPLAFLAHWDRDSSASSVAGESDLRVYGLVDLRVELRTTSGERVLHVFRFRILRGGFEKPQFLLVGAPALDALRWELATAR